MKLLKASLLVMAMSVSTSLYAQLPTKDTRTVEMNKIFEGQCAPSLQDVTMTVNYDYDFSRSYGMATAINIGGQATKINLYPVGVSSQYTFLSDSKPLAATINGTETFIYRVIFTLHKDGKVDGLLMLGKDGDCTISSTLD